MDQGFVYFNNDWVVDFQKSDKEVIKNDLIIRVSEVVKYWRIQIQIKKFSSEIGFKNILIIGVTVLEFICSFY